MVTMVDEMMQNFTWRENMWQTWTDIMELKPEIKLSQKWTEEGIRHQRRKPVQTSMMEEEANETKNKKDTDQFQ